MKTRSSSGVGQKIDLEFDVDSLRIRDLAEDEAQQNFGNSNSSIYNSLKKTSTVTDNESEQPKELKMPDPTKGNTVNSISSDNTDQTKLRDFLKNLDDE